jgi:gelsolin
MDGGIETGFNHVKPTEYKTRLMQVSGVNAKYVRVDTVPTKRESLNMGDVFVLDAGLDIWQWNGTAASVWEKRKAEDVVKALIAERNGKPKKAVLDGNENDEKFWKHLGGKGTITAAKPEKKEVKAPTSPTGTKKGPVADKAGVEAEAPKNDDENWDPACIKELYQVKIASGKTSFTPVCRGGEKVLKAKLNTKETFVLDVEDQDKEHHVYVWVGKAAGKDHQKAAMGYGMEFVKQFKLKDCWPIARVVEGCIHRDVGFTKAFDG